jgi:hypothetical protein
MRLVTYDRGGARRLGAWVEERVVDLPDAVGHPAFPTTMEAFVARSGGSLLEAACDAVERPAYWEPCVVDHPRLLTPLLPVSGPATPHAPWLLGPEDRVPWPAEGSLDYELELACVVGRAGRDLGAAQVERHVFGYTLVVGWRLAGAEPDAARYAGASLGPSIVTRDEFDPAASTITFSIDGRVRSRGGFAGAPSSFADLVAHLSRVGPLRAGEVIGSGTFPGGRGVDVGARLRPGAVVGAGATGIGTFVVALGARGEPVPEGAAPAPAAFTAGGRPRLLRAVPDLAS